MNPPTPCQETAPIPDLRLEDPDRVRRLNILFEQVCSLLAPGDRERERYGAAATKKDDALCCPVDYDRDLLSHIPERILAVDYGCGDPTGYAGPGMTVLDLGSGSGKQAFMMARKVGPSGRVIGVDKTYQMLALARGAIPEITGNLGYQRPNVEFRRGGIENLRLDLDDLERWLRAHALRDYRDLEALEAHLDRHPMVADASVDLVVSNCVLNLVRDDHKQSLLQEMLRVLRRGGSLAISDIVADVDVPRSMKEDPMLWTGCLAGAWRRDHFLESLAEVGFHGVSQVTSRFWKCVSGIDFYAVTVRAWKGKQGPCYETFRSAMYRGPFSQVSDDDGHVFRRGVFTAVCDKTAELLRREPYRRHFLVTPRLEDPARRLPFDCTSGRRVPPAPSEAGDSSVGARAGEGCDDGQECC